MPCHITHQFRLRSDAAVGGTPIVKVTGSDDLDGTRDGLRAWIPQLVEWLATRTIHAEVAEIVDDPVPLATPLPVYPASEIPGQDSLF